MLWPNSVSMIGWIHTSTVLLLGRLCFVRGLGIVWDGLLLEGVRPVLLDSSPLSVSDSLRCKHLAVGLTYLVKARH